MLSADVPSTSSGGSTSASLSGVWPPRDTITPTRRPPPSSADRRSASITLSTPSVDERLEVQPVGRVVVGRHGLGVAVDHDRLEPGLAQREAGVHAAVVELDALADPVRARPEDDHLVPGRRRHLARVLVGAVVVRRRGLELRGAGVDGLVGDLDAGQRGGPSRTSLSVDCPQVGELTVTEAEPLGPPPLAAVNAAERAEPVPLDSRCRAFLDDGEDLVEEPRIDPGRLVHRRRAARHGAAATRPRRSAREFPAPARASSSAVGDARRRSTSAGSALSPPRPCSSERSAFWSDSGNVRPMAIASPDRLHLRAEARLGARAASRTPTAAPW